LHAESVHFETLYHEGVFNQLEGHGISEVSRGHQGWRKLGDERIANVRGVWSGFVSRGFSSIL